MERVVVQIVCAAVLLGGCLRNTGGGPLTSAGSADLFVASYSPSGAHRWSKRFGGALFDHGYGVSGDSNGNVTVTGCFEGTVDFGGGPFVSAGKNDIFLASYGPSGVHRWSKRFGSVGYDAGFSVSAEAGGKVTVTGHFAGTADFGGGPLTSAGGPDVFLLQLPF